jgi:hypothetical protein
MKRIWSIEEQVFVEPVTKLRFEFTSTHTRCLAEGDTPPSHDRGLELNLFNESGNRVIRMQFDRNGACQGAIVESVEEENVPRSPQEFEEKPTTLAVPELMATDDGPMDPATDLAQDPPGFQGINLASQFAGDIE